VPRAVGAVVPGTVLKHRYRLDGPIALGGVGEVWRGTDLVLRRVVAVKLLRPEYAQDEECLARFRAEGRHAALLSHPNIAQVYDYVEKAPPAPGFLVMELVDGPSLARLLARGPLSPARTMGVVAQAACGLQAAHAAGLVHRDIKPGNLLIGRDDHVKITDFGIAQRAGSARLRAERLLTAPSRPPGAAPDSPIPPRRRPGPAAFRPRRRPGPPAFPPRRRPGPPARPARCLTAGWPAARAGRRSRCPPTPAAAPADPLALPARLGDPASTAPWNTRSRWRRWQNPAQTASGRSVGTTGAGRAVDPIR
jgi:serine/threonine protein kinase